MKHTPTLHIQSQGDNVLWWDFIVTQVIQGLRPHCTSKYLNPLIFAWNQASHHETFKHEAPKSWEKKKILLCDFLSFLRSKNSSFSISPPSFQGHFCLGLNSKMNVENQHIFNSSACTYPHPPQHPSRQQLTREEPVSYLYLVRWCTLSVRDFPGLSQNTAMFKHTGHGLVRRVLSVLFRNLPGLFFHTSAHITSPCCVLPWMTQTPPTSVNMTHIDTHCNHWVKRKTTNKHKTTCLSNIRLQHCEVLRWKKIAWWHPVALKV